MKKSVIRRYLFLSMLAGIMMGLIFPPFASLFTQYKSPGAALWFILSCVAAGIAVGGLSFLIGRMTLIASIRQLHDRFQDVHAGDLTGRMTLESNDELGRMADDFNGFMQQIGTFMTTVRESSRLTAELARTIMLGLEQDDAAATRITEATRLLAESTATLAATVRTSARDMALQSANASETAALSAQMCQSALNTTETAHARTQGWPSTPPSRRPGRGKPAAVSLWLPTRSAAFPNEPARWLSTSAA